MPGFGFCTHLQKRRAYQSKLVPKETHKSDALLLTRKHSIVVAIGSLVSGVTILITGGVTGAPLLIMIAGSVLIGAAVQSARYLFMTKKPAFTKQPEIDYTQRDFVISLAMGGVFGAAAPFIGFLNPGAHVLGAHFIKFLVQHLGTILTQLYTISLTALIKTGVISSLFVLFCKLAGYKLDYFDTIGGFVTGSLGSEGAAYLSFTCPELAALTFAIICSITPHFPYLITLAKDSDVVTSAKSRLLTPYRDFCQSLKKIEQSSNTGDSHTLLARFT